MNTDKKNLEYYLSLPYKMELVPDLAEGGYIASYPDLPGCLTVGDTVEEACENALDAKKVWLEAALEDALDIPEPDSLQDYSGQFKLRIPRSLHRALVYHAKLEGISLNQYCVYLLSRFDSVQV